MSPSWQFGALPLSILTEFGVLPLPIPTESGVLPLPILTEFGVLSLPILTEFGVLSLPILASAGQSLPCPPKPGAAGAGRSAGSPLRGQGQQDWAPRVPGNGQHSPGRSRPRGQPLPLLRLAGCLHTWLH